MFWNATMFYVKFHVVSCCVPPGLVSKFGALEAWVTAESQDPPQPRVHDLPKP